MPFPLLAGMKRPLLTGEDTGHRLYVARDGETYCEAGDECPICGIHPEEEETEHDD